MGLEEISELKRGIFVVSGISFPMFNCVDPDLYSKYGFGFKKLLNIDPIWLWIRNPDPQQHNNSIMKIR